MIYSRFRRSNCKLGLFLSTLALALTLPGYLFASELPLHYASPSAGLSGDSSLTGKLLGDEHSHARQHHSDQFDTPKLLQELANQESNEERLSRVSYRLSAASASRCAHPEMLTGMTLHDIAAYSHRERKAIEGELHLGKGFGIRLVVPDSVAANAGLKAGDTIVRVNGKELDTFATSLIRRSASYARTAEFELLLDTELRQGPAQLAVIRGGTLITITLHAAHGCGGKPVFYYEGGINAWADGTYVAVTSKMIDFAQTDEELAFVVAHEMAHNILRHGEKLKGRSMLLASLGVGSKKIKGAEIEADILGTKVLASAGYSTKGALALLERSRPMQAMSLSLTHPSISKRMNLVQATATAALLATSEPVTAAPDTNVALGDAVLALLNVQIPSELKTLGMAQRQDDRLSELDKIDWMAPKLAPWWQLQSTDLQVKSADWADFERQDVNAVQMSRNIGCVGAKPDDCSQKQHLAFSGAIGV